MTDFEYQTEMDRRLYGMSISRIKEDGTKERIDPTTVIIWREKERPKFPLLPSNDVPTVDPPY